MDLLSIISTIIAFLTGGGLVAILTVRQHKKMKEGEATQSVERGKQEQLSTVEIQDRIYERLNSRLEIELKTRDKKIDDFEKENSDLRTEVGELREEVKQFRIADKLNIGKIKELELMVLEYKETCDTCQFRLEQKAKMKKT
jgi:predicted RNase H-like nuclease (RuvC/YqgF family)